MIATSRWIAVGVVIAIVGGLARAGDASLPADAAVIEHQPEPSGWSWDVSVEARLEALDPAHPQDYFLLGEELAAEPDTKGNIELAQHLYVLALALGAGDHAHQTTAAGAALALADITRSESDRQSLRAIARSLDPRFGVRDWSRSAEVVISDDVAYDAAVTLGQIRAGWGRTVRAELRRPEIRALIDRYTTLITGVSNQNILPVLETQADSWPCPECHNERIVTKRHTGKVERRLCYTCGGNPGPALSREQLIGQLRFEAYVLRSAPRSWGSQVAADLGAPLRGAEVDEILLRFAVDPERPWYRDGQWVREPALESERGEEGGLSAEGEGLAPGSQVP
ncbi:MAG: hypothetical protein Kow0022_04000 [Phycisphaerales bacterium]